MVRRIGPIRALDLHSTRHGHSGPPLLILHGLLGSSRNWRSVAQSLAANYSVLTVDLRNHGQSPHADESGFAHMVADVQALLRKHQIPKVHLLGHSLGGKVAMAVALTHPDLLYSLIVVDIAPVPYHDRYSAILDSLRAIRIDEAPSRSAVDRELTRSIPDPGLRQFLLTNLTAMARGYRWAANLDALQQSLPELRSFPPLANTARFKKPALFVSGARSDYVREHHQAGIRQLFPAASFVTIDGAGHWPHIENPDSFLAAINAFLARQF